MLYKKAKEYILGRLRTELSPNLFYHGVPHTLDVLDAVARISEAENINDKQSLTLLKTAALFHDAGYITQYEANEPVGCCLVKEKLPEFEYDDADIKIICELIMATVIPQNPKDKLGMILCDADLDYLGRDDFDPISEKLRHELTAHGHSFLDDKWLRFEIAFLEKHAYFTASERALRDPLKQKHLENLKSMLK